MNSNLTAANVVTGLRILLIPVWLTIAEQVTPSFTTKHFSIPAFFVALLFLLLSLTDNLDGYLARSRNQVTVLGKFLDPIADKLVVFAAMLYLLEKNFLPLWIVMLVLAREFLVAALRMVVSSSGTVVAASFLGKAKTSITVAMLVVFLLGLGIPLSSPFEFFWASVKQVLLILTAVLTAWSGVDYFLRYGQGLFSNKN